MRGSAGSSGRVASHAQRVSAARASHRHRRSTGCRYIIHKIKRANAGEREGKGRGAYTKPKKGAKKWRAGISCEACTSVRRTGSREAARRCTGRSGLTRKSFISCFAGHFRRARVVNNAIHASFACPPLRPRRSLTTVFRDFRGRRR